MGWSLARTAPSSRIVSALLTKFSRKVLKAAPIDVNVRVFEVRLQILACPIDLQDLTLDEIDLDARVGDPLPSTTIGPVGS